MGAQPFGGVLRLQAQVLQKCRVVLRVVAAGHEKVLGHQQAETVAGNIEAVLLEDAAAPDTDHVCVAPGSQGEQRGDFLRCFRGGEGLAGHPVGAFAENADAVDQDDEAGKFLIAVPGSVFTGNVRRFFQLQAFFVGF